MFPLFPPTGGCSRKRPHRTVGAPPKRKARPALTKAKAGARVRRDSKDNTRASAQNGTKNDMTQNNTQLSGKLADAFGAQEYPNRIEVVVFIPDQTKDGDYVGAHPAWVERITKELVAAAGGCSVYSAVAGTWVDYATGRVIAENTTVIRAYASAAAWWACSHGIRTTLAQYQREAQQAVVGLTIGGVWCEVTS